MVFPSSTENGEKTEKVEPEPEVKEEEPHEEIEETKVKTKAKKEKKVAEEGFELWNELEVQRIKFMVSLKVSYDKNSKSYRENVSYFTPKRLIFRQKISFLLT